MEPQSAPGLLFAGCIELLHLWLQKKIRNTKGTFLAKMGTIKDRNGLNIYAAAAAAKSLQSCPTLCDPRDRSPPGSPIPGILQARTLEWVAISFSNA